MQLRRMLAQDLDMVRALVWVGSRSLSLVEVAVDVEDQVISRKDSLLAKRFKLAIWYYA